MNNQILKGEWNVLSGKLKQTWGKLTDDDMKTLEGNRQELSGILQKRYGYTADQVKKEIDQFTNKQ